MSEKRFKLVCDLHTCAIQDTTREIPTFYNDLGHISSVAPVCDLLNELNDDNKQYEELQRLKKENEQLRQTINEMQQDEQLYASEIVKLNKEAKEVLNFKTLGGDY